MREPKANSPRQRPGRPWRIPDAVEQAGAVGKRPDGPGHDRSPLDWIFGSGLKNCGFELRNFGLNSRYRYVSARCCRDHIGLTNRPGFFSSAASKVPHESHIRQRVRR